MIFFSSLVETGNYFETGNNATLGTATGTEASRSAAGSLACLYSYYCKQDLRACDKTKAFLFITYVNNLTLSLFWWDMDD